MSPQQKAVITAVRYVSAIGVLAGIVIFFSQESGRTVRHCSEYDPGCHVDPLPWGGIIFAVIAALVWIGVTLYARAIAREQTSAQPPDAA